MRQTVKLWTFKKKENLKLHENYNDMDNVLKMKNDSILCPHHLPPSRSHLVVYELSYKKDLPVPNT